MTDTSNSLPERQQQLYDVLKGRGDVPITELAAAIDSPKQDLAAQQQ